MRKIILLSFVCLSAQVFAQKSFFGSDAGVDVANQRVHVEIYNQNSSPNPYGLQPFVSNSFFQNIVRPAAGIFYHLGINEKMGVRFKAQYLCLGYKNKWANPDRVEINYLYLPVTFHYSILPKFSLSAGPYLCFTLGGTRIYQQDITGVYHKNDNGLEFGVEYDVFKNVAIGTRYILGLKNIWLNDNIGQPYAGGSVGRTEYTNRALQLTLIYKFKKPS